MANVQPQKSNKASEVKAAAANSNSVVELRAQVVKLSEDNIELRARIERLERQLRG